MKGHSAWNKGKKGIQPWMNLSGLCKCVPWNKGIKTGREPWNKGKCNPYFIGEKNPNWKGGVTTINAKIRKSVQYKQWRNAVFKRDNYTCVWCGDKQKSSGHLNADHIKPFAYFPDLRFSVKNGRTLCIDCHKTTDTYLVKARWPTSSLVSA